MNVRKWLAWFVLFALVLGPSGVCGQTTQSQSSSQSNQSSSSGTANAPTKDQQPATPAKTKPRTYTNKAGQKVQSPTQSESVPEGATAQCRDGSYSFSQTRRGTCSHHGGVAKWLNQADQGSR